MVPVTNTVLALLCKLNSKSASDLGTLPFPDDESFFSFFSFVVVLVVLVVLPVGSVFEDGRGGAVVVSVPPPPPLSPPKASLIAFSVLFWYSMPNVRHPNVNPSVPTIGANHEDGEEEEEMEEEEEEEEADASVA